MKSTKPSTCYSDNPKMGKPYTPSGKGYQDGGKVLPASKMEGGDFLRAAQRAGLPTDNATLNQIVNLVNRGYDIARATQMVKDGRAGRPEGYKDGGRVPGDEEDMRRLQISGGGSGNSTRDIGAGGRVGVNIPIDRDRDVTVGMSGSAFRAGRMSGADITGADLSYRKGDTTIGVEVSRSPTKLGDKAIMFRYKKEF